MKGRRESQIESQSTHLKTGNMYLIRKASRSFENTNSHGLTRTQSGVDVEQAEKDFADLSKTLSQHSRRMSRSYSRASRPVNVKPVNDVEKGVGSEESSQEDWSLEDTLRGAKEADLEAGIKQKHIGVIWENLTVRGIGGVKNYVKVFPQAFVDFFNVPGTIMSIFGIGKKGREFNILSGFRV